MSRPSLHAWRIKHQLKFSIHVLPTLLLYGITVVNDSELELLDEEPVVTIESLESVH